MLVDWFRAGVLILGVGRRRREGRQVPRRRGHSEDGAGAGGVSATRSEDDGMRIRIGRSALAGVAAAGLLVGGCLPEDLIHDGSPLGAFVVLVSYFKQKSSSAKSPAPVKGNLDVPLTGQIGGLSGTFTIGFDKYGQFSGVGKIGRDLHSATVKSADTPELIALVHGIVLDATGMDVTVTKASAKVVGRQTTGGVKKSWNGTIKFQGTVVSGGIAGATVKGSLKSHGHL
jgi:hypothetical protein